MTTSYDKVAYPAGIFPQTQHARLAVLGEIHGLSPARPATARVMEVGCGSGMNLIAMAAAWPDARFVGFDLAESAIRIGKAMIAKAGLTNIELFTGNICEVAKTVEPGGFDYVIAHGVYAWVPDFVREALLALYGRALSPQGMGFISYNAQPGGHVRMIMRDRLLDLLEGVDEPEARFGMIRAALEAMAHGDDSDEPTEGTRLLHDALRAMAKSMLERPVEVLFHDELGEVFAPQRLRDVVDAAGRHGLRFLTDAGRNLNLHGFLPPDMDECEDEETALVRNLQLIDNDCLRFFRQTLLVRAECAPLRHMGDEAISRLAHMHVSGHMTRNEDGTFEHGPDTIGIGDPDLAAALERMSAAYPAALPVRELVSTYEAAGGLLRLFAEWHLELRHDPQPFATAIPEYPRASPLVLAGIALGDRQILALNHTIMSIAQPELRALIAACDGTRDLAALRAYPHGIPPEAVDTALATVLRLGLFCP